MKIGSDLNIGFFFFKIGDEALFKSAEQMQEPVHVRDTKGVTTKTFASANFFYAFKIVN